MILIFFDANALHGDPLLLKNLGLRLMAHVRTRACEIHLSPVVAAELDRTFRASLGGEYDALVTRIKDIGDRYQVPVVEILANLDALRSAALERVVARRGELEATDGFFRCPWPNVSVQGVVERELARRRPFLDIEKVGTIGHRDTIIWLGLVGLAAARADVDILFVTKDKGFLDKDGLHIDLREDLAKAGIDATRVRRMSDLYSVVNFLDKIAETEAYRQRSDVEKKPEAETEQRAAAHAAIRQALHEYNEVLAKLRWGWEYDPRDGGLTEPEINAELPREMEDVSVINIETQLDVTVEPDTAETGMPVQCTHQVMISFDGAMTKADWYVHDYPDLELWDADLNDHYVSVEANRVLELTTRVTYYPTADQARVDALIGYRVIAQSN